MYQTQAVFFVSEIAAPQAGPNFQNQIHRKAQQQPCLFAKSHDEISLRFLTIALHMHDIEFVYIWENPRPVLDAGFLLLD
tara:strand:+ start:610 stop:849 length:240 start_codon:yes stop_codon:yes gene_type:complete